MTRMCHSTMCRHAKGDTSIHTRYPFQTCECTRHKNHSSGTREYLNGGTEPGKVKVHTRDADSYADLAIVAGAEDGRCQEGGVWRTRHVHPRNGAVFAALLMQVLDHLQRRAPIQGHQLAH